MDHPSQPAEREVAETLARLVKTLAAHGDSFVIEPGKAIQPTRAAIGAETTPGGAKPLLPKAPLSLPSGLAMGETLGQGGMGVVRQAKQLVLDRDVAVKTIQPKLQSEPATRMLLQEALMLGRLEHPNILPIYDIRYEGGEPRIVLKKIEGIEWSRLMHRPDLIGEAFGEVDPLDWNLGIFQQVCNAVDFAHSRGIIHRDLKPDNVMIGEFGEVYVMDWGLSLCLDDDGTGRFPLAADATELAGTPQYMAPEMLGGAVSRISARTDVYLLGSILYELIAGRPPHRGKDLTEMVAMVLVSRPPLPDDCPSELGRICRMAMDAEPGWRFESVEELRQAVQGFVQHAGSRRLETQARRRTDELLECLQAQSPARGQAERVQTLFGECRFAYEQALAIWPDNELAVTGLERATSAMIEFELAQHNPRSAANLLATLESPEPSLVERVEQAVRAAEQNERRMEDLERLSKQLDVATGTRTRAIGAAVLGLFWTIGPILAPMVMGGVVNLGHLTTLLFVIGVIFALAIWSWFAQAELRESRISRHLIMAAALAMVGQLLLEAVTALLHIDPIRTEAMWPLVWFCVSAMLVITVDFRLLPMTLGFLGTLFVGVLRPELRFYAMGVSNFIMTVNMFAVWMPLERKNAASLLRAAREAAIEATNDGLAPKQ